MKLHFPDIQEGEYEKWREIAEEIWRTTYSRILSELQIEYMLQEMYSKFQFEFSLSNDNHKLQWIQFNSKPIGFFHGEMLDVEIKTFKIHKLYIKRQFQGSGIGTLCINFIENLAKNLNTKILILHVNKYNTACQFYLKLNFTIKEDAIIDIGKGFVMDDYILTKKLFD